VAQFSADIERTSDETRQSMENAGDAIEQAIASGTDPQKAVDDMVGSQDWYKNLNEDQKQQFDEILQEYFGASPKATKKAAGVKSAISNLIDNYYKLKDKDTSARDAINEILDADPKLKYIYNNIRKINKQLQDAGVITDKTDGCP
jgi:methyl-accepting chemotaxis protein